MACVNVPYFLLLRCCRCWTQVGHALRCPAAKFITHTLSHLCFLILLAAATFRLDEKAYPITYNTSEVLEYRFSEQQYDSEVNNMLKATFRPENILMTRVQICLMFWILGNFLLS